MKKIIAANWKMHGNKAGIASLLSEITNLLDKNKPIDNRCIIFPPTIYLGFVEEYLKEQHSPILLGAQNVASQEEGAFTGEISAKMVKDYHCDYVLVGHSERRNIFSENEKIVAEKFYQVKKHDMIPLFCVGESAEDYQNKATNQTLARQLMSVQWSKENKFHPCIIAYEPVWAIGSGKTPSMDEIQETHAFIRTFLREHSELDASAIRILYGGSVNAKNAQALLALSEVDGALVGGASLNAKEFVEIITCTKSF